MDRTFPEFTVKTGNGRIIIEGAFDLSNNGKLCPELEPEQVDLLIEQLKAAKAELQ